MGWTGRGYYQRSVRQGGRVATLHYGSGAPAVAVAILDDEARRARLEARAAALAIAEEQHRLLGVEQARGVAIRRMLAIVLEASGFVRYARNPWRRRAMNRRLELALGGDVGPPPSEAEVRALALEVRQKQPGALERFAELAQRHPVAVARHTAVDLARVARMTFAKASAGPNADVAIGLEAKMEVMLAELAGEAPPPSVRLASEVVCFAWGEFWSLSAVAAHRGERSPPASEARRSAAQRRFLTSLRVYQRLVQLERGGPP
jgi:hypothetical protein